MKNEICCLLGRNVSQTLFSQREDVCPSALLDFTLDWFQRDMMTKHTDKQTRTHARTHTHTHTHRIHWVDRRIGMAKTRNTLIWRTPPQISSRVCVCVCAYGGRSTCWCEAWRRLVQQTCLARLIEWWCWRWFYTPRWRLCSWRCSETSPPPEAENSSPTHTHTFIIAHILCVYRLVCVCVRLTCAFLP